MNKKSVIKLIKPILFGQRIDAATRTILMLMHELDLNAQFIEIDTQSKIHLTSAYENFKPQHQLPCLLHKGQTIREAKVIIVYLLEWFDKDSRLYSPENTEKYSMILYIISFNENTLKPLCEDIFNEVRTKGDRGLRNFGERADNAFGTLETILSKQQYLASDTDLTIADLTILGTITGIGVVFRVHRDIRWPAIGVWYEKLRCRPSFEHAMLPAVDIFTAYFQTLVTSQNCNT